MKYIERELIEKGLIVDDYSKIYDNTELRTKRQEIWSELLEDYCHSLTTFDEDGEEIEIGKPCDIGRICDKCHYDYSLNLLFARTLLESNLPITRKEWDRFREELEAI